jgi:hypothetical protein
VTGQSLVKGVDRHPESCLFVLSGCLGAQESVIGSAFLQRVARLSQKATDIASNVLHCAERPVEPRSVLWDTLLDPLFQYKALCLPQGWQTFGTMVASLPSALGTPGRRRIGQTPVVLIADSSSLKFPFQRKYRLSEFLGARP